MKRQKHIVMTGVKAIFPLFRWKLCEICNHEFRREIGYSYFSDTSLIRNYRYVCGECCATKNDAYYHFTRN